MGNSSSKKKGKSKHQTSTNVLTVHTSTRKTDVELEEYRELPKKKNSEKRSKCFMDISIEGAPAGRLLIELRSDVNPRTAENFRVLCTGEMGFGYKGCKFHRIVPGFIVQTGDVDHKGTSKEGKGGRSIYGPTFADENLNMLSHDKPGVLAMANRGPHTNGSQFMIITDEEGCEWLDGLHTVFGEVLPESLEVLKKIEDCGEIIDRGEKRRARIVSTCTIEDCGVV